MKIRTLFLMEQVILAAFELVEVEAGANWEKLPSLLESSFKSYGEVGYFGESFRLSRWNSGSGLVKGRLLSVVETKERVPRCFLLAVKRGPSFGNVRRWQLDVWFAVTNAFTEFIRTLFPIGFPSRGNSSSSADFSIATTFRPRFPTLYWVSKTLL